MSTPQLQIASFALGDWMTNCYVLYVAGSSDCWIVDAGFEPEPLIEYVRQQHLTPSQVVLTHAHVDHIAGLSALRAFWSDLPILIHEAERAFLTEPMLNLSSALDQALIAPTATGTLAPGQTLDLDGVAFEVRHTPGHSPGGISLYQQQEGVVFVGDALFAGSIGRHDFPSSNGPLLIASVREQLLSLPDHTRVLSGHGPDTTIGEERQHNPYL